VSARLQPVGPDLWTATHTLKFPGGVRLPARMTVARLPDGTLWIHSPIPLDEPLSEELAALGRVAHVVAPSLLHHLFVSACLARYPEARLYAPPDLARKRPELTIAEELSDEAPPPWRSVLEQLVLRGAPRVNEVTFFHRPSRTLVVTDLVFHIREPEGWGTGLVLRMMGTHRRLAQSRLWRLFARDRPALRQSLERLLAWPFQLVLPGHGDPWQGDPAGLRSDQRPEKAWWSSSPGRSWPPSNSS
jgi:hypothetical protein